MSAVEPKPNQHKRPSRHNKPQREVTALPSVVFPVEAVLRPADGTTAVGVVRNCGDGVVGAVVTPKKTAGILRPPKYSNRGIVTEFPFDDGTPSRGEEGLAVVAVRERVVERVVRSRRQNKGSLRAAATNTTPLAAAATLAGAVEGYTPRTTAATTRAAVVSIAAHPATALVASGGELDAASLDRDDDVVVNKDEEEPLVFRTLADMMELAGTLPENDDVASAAVIEAELHFSCVDRDEYKRDQEDIFLGKAIFDTDDDDERTTEPYSDDDDNDDDGLWNVLGFGGEDVDEETEPLAPPRAFFQLWTALAQWVTPDAVAFVRQLQQRKVPRPSSNYDRSDVGASRCAGLMASLHLHTARCWQQHLGEPAEELRAAEGVLAALLRCFDYRRPSPKCLDLRTTRALACVLLDIVSAASRPEDFVPAPCQALGMTPDEYRYLVRCAIVNFEVTTVASTIDLLNED